MNGDFISIDDLVKPKVNNRYFEFIFAVFNAIWKYNRLKDYNFIYIPSGFSSQIIGFIIAKINKIPLVIRLRENSFEFRKYRTSSASFINVIFNKIDEEIYKRADLIVSVSNDLTSKFRYLNSNIITLWNGVDEQFFEYEMNINKKLEETIFGYIGRVSSEKGVELMFKAIENLPIKLLVFGETQISVTFPNNVEYLGIVPHENIQKAYSKINIIVLPSLTEGLPRTLQEAMLLGKAVICTDVGDNSILIDERGGWVCQRNI
ncbi:MAG: glycosyltransferase family 4 protein, partial [Candidatus Bathyarchaeota archaeon]